MRFIKVTKKSRADYMRERRSQKYSFSVLVSKEYGERLETLLNRENLTKTAWLMEKIDQDTTNKK